MNAQHSNRVIAGIAGITLLFLLPFLFSFMFADTFRLWNSLVNDLFFQLRFLIKGTGKTSPDFYFFIITDSFDNQYPDSRTDRTVYAHILEKLHAAKVKTVLCDIFFTNNPAIEKHITNESITSGDAMLAAVTARSRNVYYPFYLGRQTGGAGAEAVSLLTKKILFFPASVKRKGNPGVADPDTIHYPAGGLALAAAGLGFSNDSSDSDGIQRRLPLFYQSGRGFLPSLVLACICGYLQVDLSRIEIHYGQYLKLPDAQCYGVKKDLLIPIDAKGRLIINFTGPVQKSLAAYSLEKVLAALEKEGSDLPGLLQDTFVFIGDISTRGKDLGRGIFDAVYPDSFVLGSAVNTILTGSYLTDAYPVKNCVLIVLILSLFFLFRFTAFNRSSRGFMLFWLLFLSISILLILGINLWCFLFLGNLSRVVELLLGSLCAACGLVVFKLPDFYTGLPAAAPILPQVMPREPSPAAGTPAPGGKGGLEKPGAADPEAALKAMGIVTKKQLETALLIIEGLTNKEIADKLCITTFAVKRRIQGIYAKCCVKRRAGFIKKIYGIE